jgi:hypothetical protein
LGLSPLSGSEVPPEVDRNVAMEVHFAGSWRAPHSRPPKVAGPREQTLTLRLSGFWCANNYLKRNLIR